MQKMTYIIRDKNGLHARPAGLIVQAAKGYKSKVSISAGEKSADCKKLFQVMGLGIKCGDEVTLSAEGEDEEGAVGDIGKTMRDAGL